MSAIPPFPFHLIKKHLGLKRVSRGDVLELRTAIYQWFESVRPGEWMDYLKVREHPTMKFVDYTLSTEEKQAALHWAASSEVDVLSESMAVVTEGYKISHVYDQKNGCFIISLIGRQKDLPNYDMCMSTRHGDYMKAITMALYKEIVIFGGSAWDEASPENNWG